MSLEQVFRDCVLKTPDLFGYFGENVFQKCEKIQKQKNNDSHFIFTFGTIDNSYTDQRAIPAFSAMIYKRFTKMFLPTEVVALLSCVKVFCI